MTSGCAFMNNILIVRSDAVGTSERPLPPGVSSKRFAAYPSFLVPDPGRWILP